MKIRITLITGSTIDFEAPADFNLVGWAVSVRETGRFLVENCYVPHDKIVSVLRLDPEGKIEIKGVLQ